MTHLLIVEDEEHLATGLKFNLEAEGYEVSIEDNGKAALDLLTDSRNGVDLVLLDVMLPSLDGFEVVRRLREAGSFVPVVMLTARGQIEDVLRGFELGADDYLPKPFDLSILIARIQGLLRRKTWLEIPSKLQSTDGHEELHLGDARVDFSKQTVERAGLKKSLTLMEATLLRFLVEREGHAVKREVLLEEVWGVRKDTDTRTIDNFIARLRRVVEEEPSKPKYLQTVRGVGYRFVAHTEAD